MAATSMVAGQFGIWARNVSWLGPAGAALLCLALTLPYLDHVADYDEFYTLLAARGWLETGAPVIEDGEYSRAFIFTFVQALFFSIFGESVVVGRLPSLLANMALAAGLFVWVRRIAGTWAATLAALIFAVTPLTIEMGQFGRFYALHALTVSAMTLLAFYACHATGQRRIVLGIAALAMFVVSMNLQPTTVIAVCAISVWIAGTALHGLWPRLHTWQSRAIACAALAMGIGLVAAALIFSGVGAMLWHEFRSTTFWGAIPERADNFRFYHQALDHNLGFLWSLFPIAAVIAVAAQRGKEMLFMALFVGVTLALFSLAAQKDERYAFYILPFIAVLLGVGLATALSAYLGWLQRMVPAVLTGFVTVARAKYVAITLAAVSALFAFANNPPVSDVLRMLGGASTTERLDYSWIANWPAEVAALRPAVEPPTILVTSSGMKAIYYFGGYDFELNANVADETDTRRDFGIDPRTGRQAMSSAASTELLMSCYPDIVFIFDESRWSRDTAVPVATSALIEARSERLPTHPNSKLLAFRATNPGAAESSNMCKELRPGRRQ